MIGNEGGTYSALYSIMTMENALGHSSKVLFTKTSNQQFDKYYSDENVHIVEISFPKRFSFSKEGAEWLKKILNYIIRLRGYLYPLLLTEEKFLKKDFRKNGNRYNDCKH